MKKIVFDNNILDKLVNLYKTNPDIIDNLVQNYELSNCDTLKRELENISDTEKRNTAKEILKKFQVKDSFIFGFADLDSNIKKENTHGFLTKKDLGKNIKVKMLTYNSYKTYKKIHPNAIKPKKESDRQIALIASAHNAELIVTNDKDFKKHLENTSIKVMTFEEFLQ